MTYGERHVYFWKLFWNKNNETVGKIIRDEDSGIFQVRRESVGEW